MKNSSLTLESDIKTWTNVFFSTLEPREDFSNLISDLTNVMNSILKEKNFPPDFTDYFFNETLPGTIKRIIHFQNIPNLTRKQKIMYFFRKAVEFIYFSLKNNIEKLFSPLISMLDPDAIIYQKNLVDGDPFFLSIYKEYFISENSKKVSFFFIDNKNVTISQFNFIFKIYSANIKGKLKKMIQELAAPIMQPYVEYINEIDNLHEVNTRALQDSLISFIELMNNTYSYEIYTQLFTFLAKCLESDMIDKQAITAKTVSSFCNTTKSDFFTLLRNDQIKECIQNILDKAVNPNLSIVVVNLFIPFFEAMCNPKVSLINFEHISKLYDIASNTTDSEQQSPLFSFIANSLDGFPEEVQLNIIDYITRPPNKSCSYKFLTKMTKLFWTNHQEKALNNVRLILSDTERDQSAREAIISIYKQSIIPDAARVLLVKEILKKISQNEESSEFAQNVLCSMIDSTNGSKVFKTEINDEIIQKMTKDNKEHIFKVLTKLFSKSSILFTKSDFQLFTSFGTDDKLWTFYKDLIDTNKMTHSYNYFDLIIEQAQEQASSSPISKIFIEFLISLIEFENKALFNSWKKKNSTNEGSPKYIDILFSAFASSTDNKATTLSENYLLQIYSTMKPVREFLSFYIESQLKEADFLNNYNVLQIILKFIEISEVNIDPEDFDHPRHKYSSDYIILNCTRNDTDEFSIHIKPDSTLLVLLQRIGIKRNEKKATSTKFNKSSDEKKKLSELGIKNNDSFAFSASYDKFDNFETPFSLFLMNNGFVGKLLSLSKNDLDEKFVNVIEKLLDVLPTDEAVYKNKFNQMSRFVKKLTNESSSKIKKKYYLQSLLAIFRENKQKEKSTELESFQFIKNKGIEAVSNLMLTSRDPFYFEFLNELFFKNEKYFETSLEIIIIRFLDSVIENWADSTSFLLFEKCLRNFTDQSREIIDSNKDKFILSLNKVTKEHWKDYAHSIYLDLSYLFNIEIESINQNQINLPFYVKLLSRTIKTIINEQDNNEVPPILYSSEFLEQCCSMLKWNEVQPSIEELVEIIFLITKNFSSKNEELKEITKQHEEMLVSIVFNNSDSKTQQKLINLIKLCYTDVTELYLEKLFTNNKDVENHWNYTPELYKRESPYIGLRNLGATCFFNSIIQQLYHLYPVQYLMATYKFKKDSELNLLQSLFLKMHYSERKYSDTESFIKQWHGWLNELINPREQHDAVEFFGFLIDCLPDPIKKLFTGKLINTITRSNGDIFHSDSEPFINLGVQIKELDNLEKSLNNFISTEELKKQDDLTNKTITVYKSLRVQEAPPVLVIHLKRFDYIMASWERKKLNDKFTFPCDLNIDKISQNPTNTNYKLVGIVVHSGTAIGGHYISFVRKNANRSDSQWWKFNDTEVSQVSIEDVESAAYGGISQPSSAYVLFYIKEDFVLNVDEINASEENDSKSGENLKEEGENKNDNDEHLNEDDGENCVSFFKELDYTEKVDIDFIIKDNISFRQTQSMFSEPIIDFVLSIKRNVLLSLTYFNNILCHSQFDKRSKEFSEDLIDRIEKYNQQKECLLYLYEHVYSVGQNLISPSHDDIIKGLCDIIICCSKEDISICIPLLTILKDHVYLYVQTPRIYEMVYKILNNVIEKFYKDKSLNLVSIHLLMNKDANIDDPFRLIYHKVQEIITLAYTESRPQLFSSLNFSSLFNIIQELIGKVNEIDLSTFHDFESMITKSNHHYTPFKRMMRAYDENQSKKRGSLSSSSFFDQSKSVISSFKPKQTPLKTSLTTPKSSITDTKQQQQQQHRKEPTYSPKGKLSLVISHDPIVSSANTSSVQSSGNSTGSEREKARDICKLLTNDSPDFQSAMKDHIGDKSSVFLKDFYDFLLRDFQSHPKLIANFIKRSPNYFICFFTKNDQSYRKQTFEFYKQTFSLLNIDQKETLIQNFTKYIKNDFQKEINHAYNVYGAQASEENSLLIEFLRFYGFMIKDYTKRRHFDQGSVKTIFETIQCLSKKNVKNDVNLKELLSIFANLEIELTNGYLEIICDIILKSDSPQLGSCFSKLFVREREERALKIIQSENFRDFVLSSYNSGKLQFTAGWSKDVYSIIPKAKPILNKIFDDYKKEKKKIELSEILKIMIDKNKTNQPISSNDLGIYLTSFFETILSKNPDNKDVQSFGDNLGNYFKKNKNQEIGKFSFDTCLLVFRIQLPSFPQKNSILDVLKLIFKHSSTENDNLIFELIDLQIRDQFKEMNPAYFSELTQFLLNRNKEIIIKRIVMSLLDEKQIKSLIKVCNFIKDSIKEKDSSSSSWDQGWIQKVLCSIHQRVYRSNNDNQFLSAFISALTDENVIQLFKNLQDENNKHSAISYLVRALEKANRRKLILKLQKVSHFYAIPNEIKDWKLNHKDELGYFEKIISEISDNDENEEEEVIIVGQSCK